MEMYEVTSRPALKTGGFENPRYNSLRALIRKDDELFGQCHQRKLTVKERAADTS
jgi:hypothetical protein